MEHQEPQTKQIQEPIATGENQSQTTTAGVDHEESVSPTPFQRFRALLESAQRSQNPVASRRELGRDKSKSLFVLVGASFALLLLFFGLFSSPKNRGQLPGETARGGPSLGRKFALCALYALLSRRLLANKVLGVFPPIPKLGGFPPRRV